MPWFGDDFNRFFKDLAKNNDKAWFDANRARYEASVKRPFEAFVAEAIARIARHDRSMVLTPKDAIFRIHRDIRFSRDKTPYKLEASAIISQAGRRDHRVPGIYFAFGPEAVKFYGGCYLPDREQLHRIRTAIVNDGAGFRKVIGAKAFREKFGEVQGERNKVLPPPFKAAAVQEPLVAHKQFYVGAELRPSLVRDPGLMELFMDHYLAMAPFNAWLGKAMR